MDWLKVAAVTGAGYAAKYLQKFSQDRDGLLGLPAGNSFVENPDSSSLIQQMHDKNLSLHNSADRADQLPSFDKGNGSHSDERFWERTLCNIPLQVEMSSTSGFEGDFCDNINDTCEASTCGTGNVKGTRRGRSSLRSKHCNLNNLKPISSLESCLMAQLYKKHAEMEKHVLVPLPSPCTTALRPFVVTDGTQIISQSNCDSFNVQVRDGKDKVHKMVYQEANEAVFDGIPPLPEIRLEEVSREKNLKKRKAENGKFSSAQGMPNQMQISPQGSPTGAILFCLGVSVGIISSILANKTEVTKLQDLLKQTENLVQDLQEELEMKDSLTVKELVNEDNVYPWVNENSADKMVPIKPLVPSDMLTKYIVEASDTQKASETRESMSTIEAELEAELERLELNIKKSRLPERLSDNDELSVNFVAEVVQGELQADILSRKPSSDPSLDHDSSRISTPSTPKQAVSPRELSLRLHQVIQSRLEQRVTELESALENSQKRIVQLQSEQELRRSWSGFSRTDVLSFSPSTQGSPITIGTPVETESDAQGKPPLVMNLAGDALDAYNEARREFDKVNRCENEEDNFEIYKSPNRILIEKQNEKENGPFPFGAASVGVKTSKSRMIEESEKFWLDENEDESKDKDDDMAQLIKQIVERARQGSPAILQAHRAMLFLDKNEE